MASASTILRRLPVELDPPIIEALFRSFVAKPHFLPAEWKDRESYTLLRHPMTHTTASMVSTTNEPLNRRLLRARGCLASVRLVCKSWRSLVQSQFLEYHRPSEGWDLVYQPGRRRGTLRKDHDFESVKILRVYSAPEAASMVVTCYRRFAVLSTLHLSDSFDYRWLKFCLNLPKGCAQITEIAAFELQEAVVRALPEFGNLRTLQLGDVSDYQRTRHVPDLLVAFKLMSRLPRLEEFAIIRRHAPRAPPAALFGEVAWRSTALRRIQLAHLAHFTADMAYLVLAGACQTLVEADVCLVTGASRLQLNQAHSIQQHRVFFPRLKQLRIALHRGLWVESVLYIGTDNSSTPQPHVSPLASVIQDSPQPVSPDGIVVHLP